MASRSNKRENIHTHCLIIQGKLVPMIPTESLTQSLVTGRMGYKYQ